MKKLMGVCALLLLGAALLFAGGGKENFELTVLTTNDTHGHPLPFAWATTLDGVAYNSPEAGGIAARATYFKQVQAEETNVLIVDAGDVMTGLVVSNYHKAKPDILGMNEAGYQVMALGNHEFDNGIGVLKSLDETAEFPFVSANVFDKKTGKLFTQAYQVVQLKDIKVGVIGITTPETVTATLPANVEALEFRDPAASIKAILDEVRSKSDFVVVLSHLGLADDRALAAKLSGVDLLIGGHSHSFMKEAEIVNGIPIFQAYEWGLFVGRIDIEVKGRKISSVKAVPVPINLSVALAEGATAKGVVREIGGKKYDFIGGYYGPDAEIAALLKPFDDEVKKDLDTVIGTASAAFPDSINGLARYPRRDDSALSNMVTDAMRETTSVMVGRPVDVFLQNGGGIRATLAAGPITKRGVYAVLPFDNTIQTAQITGAKLLEVLEKNALPVILDNYTAKWDSPSGAFLQVSGMSFTVDVAAKTLSDVKVGGAAIDPAKTYLVASQNFMMTGGDGYTVLKELPGKFETSQFQRDAVLAWIEKKKDLNPADFEDNRINLVNTGR